MSIALLFSAALVTMTPDYAGITVPPNVAPLNFDLDRAAAVTLAGPDGATLAKRGREIRFSAGEWRDFLAKCRGRSYVLDVRPDDGTAALVATNAVSDDVIDAYLTYRLIAPSYVSFDEMGIFQRNLTTFDEKALYRTVQTSRDQCVNCHTTRQGDPETFLFHKRAVDGGTVIAHPKYGLRKHTLKACSAGFSGNVTYPAWHPSGEFIAFSANETRQSFHLVSAQKVEVADMQSDLVLFSLADGRVTTIEFQPRVLESFPTWSPDGKTLYTAQAVVGYDVSQNDEEARGLAVFRNVDTLRYGIVARAFDAATRTFSPPRTVVDANRRKATHLFPRVSPDGRWLVATAAGCGAFPIWHRDADLVLVDLTDGSVRKIDEINSPNTDSYHCFSTNGKWMVFSSRRDDGNYTRPYFTHFDAKTGRFTKPFLLPMENPVEHDRRFRSYNIPEFATGPVKHSPRALRTAR